MINNAQIFSDVAMYGMLTTRAVNSTQRDLNNPSSRTCGWNLRH